MLLRRSALQPLAVLQLESLHDFVNRQPLIPPQFNKSADSIKHDILIMLGTPQIHREDVPENRTYERDYLTIGVEMLSHVFVCSFSLTERSRLSSGVKNFNWAVPPQERRIVAPTVPADYRVQDAEKRTQPPWNFSHAASRYVLVGERPLPSKACGGLHVTSTDEHVRETELSREDVPQSNICRVHPKGERHRFAPAPVKDVCLW